MVNENYKLSFYLGDTWKTYDAQIDNFSITEKMHNDLKSADNSASIVICHNVELENALRAIGFNGIKAKIEKDNNLLFAGYVRRNFTFTNNGRVQNTKLELVSPSFTLKRKINSRYEAVNKTVTAIITELLTLAGVDMTGAEIPTITEVIPYLSINSDDGKTYFEILEGLYFEYGFVIDFGANGAPCYYSWLSGEAETDQEFNASNILGTLSQAVKDEAHANIEVKWQSVKQINGGNIFSDTTNGGSVNKCNLYIAKGHYLGVEDGTDTGLYCEYSTEGYELLYATGVNLNYKIGADSAPVILKEFTPYGRRAWLSMKNENEFTTPQVHITQLDINADTAFVKVAENTSKVTRSNSPFADTMNYSANYIFNQENGDRLAGELAKYYQFSDYVYTIQSKTNYACGSIVKVNDPETGNVLCRITSKVSNEKTGVYSYQLEGIGEYEPAVESEKIQLPSANANIVTIKQEVAEVKEDVTDMAGDVQYCIETVAKVDAKYNGAILNIEDIPASPKSNDYFVWGGDTTASELAELGEFVKGQLYTARYEDGEFVYWAISTDAKQLSVGLKDIFTYMDAETPNTYAIAFIQNLFANEIVVNDLIKSANYEEATAMNKGNGFILNSDGSVEFNNIKINFTKLIADEKNNVSLGNSNFVNKNANTKYNIALGSGALETCTGEGNISIGYEANKNTTGSQNIGIGRSSLGGINKQLSGSSNIGIGQQSGEHITTGSDNICIGDASGLNLTTGSKNIYIGLGTMAKSATEKNEVNINNSIMYNEEFGFMYKDENGYTKPILKGYKCLSSSYTASVIVGSLNVSNGDVLHVVFLNTIQTETPETNLFSFGVTKKYSDFPTLYPVKIYKDGVLINMPYYKLRNENKYNFLQAGTELDLMFCTSINGNYWLVLGNSIVHSYNNGQTSSFKVYANGYKKFHAEEQKTITSSAEQSVWAYSPVVYNDYMNKIVGVARQGYSSSTHYVIQKGYEYSKEFIQMNVILTSYSANNTITCIFDGEGY